MEVWFFIWPHLRFSFMIIYWQSLLPECQQLLCFQRVNISGDALEILGKRTSNHGAGSAPMNRLLLSLAIAQLLLLLLLLLFSVSSSKFSVQIWPRPFPLCSVAPNAEAWMCMLGDPIFSRHTLPTVSPQHPLVTSSASSKPIAWTCMCLLPPKISSLLKCKLHCAVKCHWQNKKFKYKIIKYFKMVTAEHLIKGGDIPECKVL